MSGLFNTPPRSSIHPSPPLQQFDYYRPDDPLADLVQGGALLSPSPAPLSIPHLPTALLPHGVAARRGDGDARHKPLLPTTGILRTVAAASLVPHNTGCTPRSPRRWPHPWRAGRKLLLNAASTMRRGSGDVAVTTAPTVEEQEQHNGVGLGTTTTTSLLVAVARPWNMKVPTAAPRRPQPTRVAGHGHSGHSSDSGAR